MEIIHKELSYKLTGIFFQIQNTFGRILKEKQYCDMLESSLQARKLTYQREIPLTLEFNGQEVKGNIADFIVERRIILEIKAKNVLLKEDYLQLRRYLLATQLKLGLLVNFRAQKIKPLRILNRTGSLSLDSH